jgi:FAD/FMN-containing dehydrogenase
MTTEEVVAQVREAAVTGAGIDVRGEGTITSRLAGGGDRAAYEMDMTWCAGIVRYDPEDLTVTVRANTAIAELDRVLGAQGQECALDVWGTGRGSGTVAGRIAAGLAGRRALARGSVRDLVLGLGFVTGEGRFAHAGGATVKNVTGYDVVRLLTGSWGTLAVFTEVTLKLSPIPQETAWFVGEAASVDLGALFAPSAVLHCGGLVHVLLEGDSDDCAEQARAAGLRAGAALEVVSTIRVAVPPPMAATFQDLAGAVTETALGLVHLPSVDAADDLIALRVRAEAAGGRVLVLDPDAAVDPFRASPPSAYEDRLKDAFDPQRVLAPWRRP